MTNTPTRSETMVERVALAIAQGLGDDFDHAFTGKAEWISERGEKGGRFRDCNEPMQPDYLDSARAAIEAMREPDFLMKMAGASAITVEIMEAKANYDGACDAWQAMITAALGEGK